MDIKKAEGVLEKPSVKGFIGTLFARMIQNQNSPNTDIIQSINETIEVADISHSSVSPAAAFERAVKILQSTHWARSTFSSDISAAYKLLLHHSKALPYLSGAVSQKSTSSPGLDGSLFNSAMEKVIDSFFLNGLVASFITKKLSRRTNDAVSFPSFHTAILACQIARDISSTSIKLHTSLQEGKINTKLLTDQLRHTARAMATMNLSTVSSTDNDNSDNSSSVLADCLAAFKPSKIPPASKVDDKSKQRPNSSKTGDKNDQTKNIPNINDFTISILDTFFVLY